jgi:hypothetical protein
MHTLPEAMKTVSPKGDDVDALARALAAPFGPNEVNFKPAVVSGNRAMALPYIDARVIQDRLDQVVGVMGWQDEYECLPDGSVVCKLHLRLGDEWITKMDVGGPSEQPDEGDRRKAAFSDALKRAAVKFGIGRYLYRLPSQWVDYDPKKRQFVNKPTIGPPVVVPKARSEQNVAKTGPVTAPPPAKNSTSPASAPMTASATSVENRKRATGSMPTNGVELQKRLLSYDAQLARQGLCAEGTLVQHILDAGKQAGLGPDLATWTGSAINLAVEETRHFETAMRQGAKKEVA